MMWYVRMDNWIVYELPTRLDPEKKWALETVLILSKTFEQGLFNVT